MNSVNSPAIEIIQFDHKEQKSDGRKKKKGKEKELASDKDISSEYSEPLAHHMSELARQIYKARMRNNRASKQERENKKRRELGIQTVEGYKKQKRRQEENTATAESSLGGRESKPSVMDECNRKLLENLMVQRRKNHHELMDAIKANSDISKAILDELVKLNQKFK